MAEPDPVRLILGSGSLGRRELLRLAGYRFEVMPAGIDEPEAGFPDARSLVQHVAWLKAAAIAPRVAEGVVHRVPLVAHAGAAQSPQEGWIGANINLG